LDNHQKNLAEFEDFKLTFVASKPPPLHLVYQELLVAAEALAEYFL